MTKATITEPAHDRHLLSRRALNVFIPLLLLLAMINVALLVASARQAHAQIEQTMLNSLHMLRSSSAIAEDIFAVKLEEGLQIFRAEYLAHDGKIEEIDLARLQQRLGNYVDLYAIDASGVVRHSTLANDIGLDFRQWPEFIEYLEWIRQSGVLHIDAISKETKTGFFRKYAYLPTPDNLWILELGIKPDIIAQKLAPFDPAMVAQRLVENIPHLKQVRMIDRLGWQNSMTLPTQVEPEVFERVKRVLETRKIHSVLGWNRLLSYLPLPYIGDENANFLFQYQVVEVDYELNQIIFGVGINLFLVLVSIALVLNLNRWMKQSEERLRAANEAAEAANLRLTELSATDGLTGIANRRRFDEIAALEWARSTRSGEPLALLLMDVDHFKAYNDNYGHPAGDETLKQVAQVLRKHARRPSDLAARYGGEEFVMIAADTTADAALTMAQKIQASVEALALPHEYSTHGVLTISIGVAVATAGSPATLEDLIGMADKALYKAKNAGRNRAELIEAKAGNPQ